MTYIINIKTSGTIHYQPKEYMEIIEKEIKEYNMVIRTKKLERICQ